jgi:DNA-binding NtrC family response regulator
VDTWLECCEARETSEGLLWTPTEKTRRLLPFKQPLDTWQRDFKLEADLVLEEGELPNFIFNGVQDYQNFFPDYNGYLIGPTISGNDLQIKKEGRLIHLAPAGPLPNAEEAAVTVVRRGPNLACFVNGRLVIGYRDAEMAGQQQSFLYLFLRYKSRLLIRSLSLSTQPSEPAAREAFNEVSFLAGRDNRFQFHPLIHELMYQGRALHYGFVFYDISAFRRDIAFLKKARERISRERDKYKALVDKESGKDLAGESPALVRIKREALKAAASNLTILIEGETGTGKEVLAGRIHGQSPYAKGPFIKVDCAGLPETLLESELFGAEKGAFTGAAEARAGKLEAAAGGTLFLDELANINLSTQAKLLNFLQDFTLTRLGSTRKIKVDTRVIAATNAPLKALVEKGAFRADLYYRLSAVKFTLPPLRERQEDIALLCTRFLQEYNAKFNKAVQGFSPAGHKKLLSHHWLGNVRELENVVKKAVLFCEGDVIDADRIEIVSEKPAPAAPAPPEAPALNIPRGDARALTREHIAELLRRHNGIVVRAAAEAGVARSTLFRKIRQLGISS